MTMYRTTWLTPSERRYRSSPPRTRCGSNGVSSNMSVTHPDTERSALIGVWADGRFVLGPEGGTSEERITAAETVTLNHERSP